MVIKLKCVGGEMATEDAATKDADTSERQAATEDAAKDALINMLPPEILMHVFKFVGDTTLIKSVPAVCRNWRNICRDLIKPSFLLSPDQWTINAEGCGWNLKQCWLNCLVIRFAHAFKQTNVKEKVKEVPHLLFDASNVGYLNIVRYLIEEAQVEPTKANISYNSGWTAMHHAAYFGHLDIVKYLVEEAKADPTKTNNDGETPLYFAIKRGYLNVVQYLVEHLADPNEVDDNAYTMLHDAALYGQIHIVQYLVEKRRINPNKPGEYKKTALHAAVKGGRRAVVNYLRPLWLEYKRSLKKPDPYIIQASSDLVQEFIKQFEQNESTRVRAFYIKFPK